MHWDLKADDNNNNSRDKADISGKVDKKMLLSLSCCSIPLRGRASHQSTVKISKNKYINKTGPSNHFPKIKKRQNCDVIQPNGSFWQQLWPKNYWRRFLHTSIFTNTRSTQQRAFVQDCVSSPPRHRAENCCVCTSAFREEKKRRGWNARKRY